MLVVLWAIFGWASCSAWRAKVNFKAYDPFEILGIGHVSSWIVERKLSGSYRVGGGDFAAGG